MQRLTNAELIIVLATIETDDCTDWPNGTDSCGYSKVWFQGKHVGGHRISLGQRLGRDLLREEHALHTCDNPLCVNPRHLFLGTPLSNNQDMYAKNRDNNLKGSAHGRAKLTEAQARTVKQMYADGTSIADIARHIGSPYTRVWAICMDKNWRHV